MAQLKALIACLFLLLTGCATTIINDSWRNPSYTGKDYGPILIVVMSSDKKLRNTVEQGLTDKFDAAGIRAVPSSEIAPEYEQLNREFIEPIIKQEGYGSVFVVRLVDRRQETYYIPEPRNYASTTPSTNIFSNGYERETKRPRDSDYYMTIELIYVSMELYDADSGVLIWKSTTESFSPRTTNEIASVLPTLAIKVLTKHGLL